MGLGLVDLLVFLGFCVCFLLGGLRGSRRHLRMVGCCLLLDIGLLFCRYIWELLVFLGPVVVVLHWVVFWLILLGWSGECHWVSVSILYY